MNRAFSIAVPGLLWWVISLNGVACYGRTTGNPKAKQPETFTVSYKDTTVLQALLDFSMRNQIASGIVLVPDSGVCVPLKNLTIKNARIENILDGLLKDSGYAWSNDHGVYLIKPKIIPQSSDRVLHLKYPQFTSKETTLQGLGIILSARIRSSLESTGSAMSILSSSDSTTVNPFTLENATVEQIANYIVNLDERGVWILEPHPYESGQMNKGRLQIYGYRDDAARLKNLSCVMPSKQ